MANSVLATVIAYILYILFESPYVNLMKLFVMPLITGRRTPISATAINNNNEREMNDNGIGGGAGGGDVELNKLDSQHSN